MIDSLTHCRITCIRKSANHFKQQGRLFLAVTLIDIPMPAMSPTDRISHRIKYLQPQNGGLLGRFLHFAVISDARELTHLARSAQALAAKRIREDHKAINLNAAGSTGSLKMMSKTKFGKRMVLDETAVRAPTG
jgi:hypothetical protein